MNQVKLCFTTGLAMLSLSVLALSVGPAHADNTAPGTAAPGGAGPVAAAAPAHPVPPMLNGVHNLVTLGDSITQFGGGPGGYVWLMQQYLNALYPDAKIQVLNAGISGHKSNDMLGRYDHDVVGRKADLVTISVGINDVWHGFDATHPQGGGTGGISLGDYRRNLQAMVDMAQKNSEKVVLFTPTIFEDSSNSPRNEMNRDYVLAVRDMAQREGLGLADENAVMMDIWQGLGPEGRPRLTVDQVHMSALGNIIMARTALMGLGIPAADLDAAWTQVHQAQMGAK
ncbi:MAG: SGNH/GDSL hydrolase family protein [Armatimonadota bacterium]|nr:SGNH/GDSL hydrolase family protein [Armatimonadota bacterium]